MSDNNVLLKISGVNKTIGKRQILHDITFEAYAGEVFGFLGPNGLRYILKNLLSTSLRSGIGIRI